jgi:hypothetical protein
MTSPDNAAHMPNTWHSSGAYLLNRLPGRGGLEVTPDYLRAFLARPELAPVDESCDAERALHAALLDDPVMQVDETALATFADGDARDNYRIFLSFRDLLASSGTLEKAYMTIVRGEAGNVPPLFVEQLVHAITASILHGQTDPLRWRAAELFFRPQSVSTDEGQLMLADEEVVEQHAETGGMGGLGQLVMEAATPLRQVQLDVLDEDNKQIYWQRSERFDTVIDFRFTQPANDAFARVIEHWINHFLGVVVRVQPVQRIDDGNWTWHIGMDAEATRLLNKLYNGDELGLDEQVAIIGLFRMEIPDDRAVLERVRGRPVWLALAKTPAGKLVMKPQNLLLNMPLQSGA